jgi:hypothetical protein
MKICPECGGELREVLIYCNPGFDLDTRAAYMHEIVELECEDCGALFTNDEPDEEVIF